MRDGVVKLCCMYVNAIKYFSPEQFSSSMLSCELSGEKAFARVRCLRHLNIPNTITNAARRDRVVARAIKMDLDDPGDDDDDVEDACDDGNDCGEEDDGNENNDEDDVEDDEGDDEGDDDSSEGNDVGDGSCELGPDDGERGTGSCEPAAEGEDNNGDDNFKAVFGDSDK